MNGEQPNVWIQGVNGTQVLPLIESDERFIRVEAGPGTGKTFGVVRRVQRILHPKGLGVPGSQVLVVAFNRVIAQTLREDIALRLKGTELEGKGPTVSTIHSLCLEILGRNTRMLMDHERAAMLYDIRTSDARVRDRFSTFEATSKALQDHEAGHIQDTLLGELVDAWLIRHKATLTGDLPKALLNQMKAGNYDEKKYRHIIADEFQDFTSAEQQLIVQLLAPEGQLVALGDGRQSIYHFRGNEPRGLSMLEELTGSKVFDVKMVENQRNPAMIVLAANDIQAASSADPMMSVSTVDANTHHIVWVTPEGEARGMAEHIHANYVAHPDQKHLVMVTRRIFGYMLRDELVKLAPDLAINLCFSEGLLETWAAREAFLLFCLMNAPDAPSWRAWLGYQQPTVGKTYKADKRNSPAYLKLMEELKDKLDEHGLKQYVLRKPGRDDGPGATSIRRRINRFLNLKDKFSGIEDPLKLIAAVFEPTQWIESWMKDGETATNDLKLIKDLAENLHDKAVDETAEKTNVLSAVASQMRAMIATREVAETKDKTDIQVSTLWSAKGVTADHVYVLGLCEEAIPGEYQEAYRGTEEDYLAEQQRLFYVTITRSKHTLVLSRAKKIRPVDAAKQGLKVGRPQNGLSDLKASPFVVKIMHRLPDWQPGEHWSGCAPT